MKIKKKTNICTICKSKGNTDWYNIDINQDKLFSDPNNMIELCNKCQNKITNGRISSEREHTNYRNISDNKKKSREIKAVAKQKSRDGRVLSVKRNLERKNKQERITSRKKS